MKKNVITILVDSVYSDCIGTGRTYESSTPFLDSIIPDSVFTKNVFSYGPYTDAATKGLFCGNRTLDDYGYYFSINSSDYTHYRVFKEAGYETVGLYYPYYLISSKVEQYIDKSIYISGFLYESVWNGKYKYYAVRKEKSELTDVEYKILEKCTLMLFDCWSSFYNNMEKGESGYIIDRIKRSEIRGYDLLQREMEKFSTEKRRYINSILEQGMEHPLAKINDYDYNQLVLQDFVQEVFRDHRDFFSKVQRTEFRRNMRNNFPDTKHFVNGIAGLVDRKRRDDFRYLENFGMSLFGNRFLKRMSKRDMWQIEASMMNQINAIFYYLDHRLDDKAPFYVSMHTEEPHNRLTYFTYDIRDKHLVDEEINYMKPLIQNIGKDFAGHIIYQLSLRYVDLCLQRLFQGLQERGLLTRTTIMVMADHGSSYTLNPLRNTVTNNFYLENYKTPLLIWDSDLDQETKKEYTGYYQGSDVFPTLCDIVGVDSSNKMKGESIISHPEGKKYIITEYMGPGCPDMISRELWLSITDGNYHVAVKVMAGNSLNREDVVEIYDLKKDPMQKKNKKVELLDSKQVELLLNTLSNRVEEINRTTNSIISNLDQFRVVK